MENTKTLKYLFFFKVFKNTEKKNSKWIISIENNARVITNILIYLIVCLFYLIFYLFCLILVLLK